VGEIFEKALLTRRFTRATRQDYTPVPEIPIRNMQILTIIFLR